MADLDPTVEIGPAIAIRLSAEGTRNDAWWIKLPLRAVLSVDGLDIGHQGWIFAPYAEYVIKGDGRGWVGRSYLSIAVGPTYADHAFHDYYYRVAPGVATAQRPAFETSGGYSGSRITLTWNRRHGDWWYGWFARYDNLSGAAFDASPLVKDSDFLATGFAVARVLSGGRSGQ
jgi:hypothetical protein